MQEKILDITSEELKAKQDNSLKALEVAIEGEKKNSAKIRKTVITFIYALGVVFGIGAILFLRFKIFDYKPNISSVINFYDDYLFADLTNDSDTPKLLQNSTSLNVEVPRTEESPLNGVLFTKAEMDEMKKRRPIAVTVNNLAFARPQSNITQADLVYETLVESGITRYLPIYWSNKVEEVGPIRSVRNYHLELLSEFDAILIHDGNAYSDDPRLDALGNLSKYSIKTVRTYSAWRWNDGIRYAPHNEYASPVAVWEYAKTKDGWTIFPTFTSWKFKKDATIEERGKQSEVRVSFSPDSPSNQYSVNWIYNSSTNKYLREVGSKKDIDQKTKTQVEPKTVIVQEVDLLRPPDDAGRIVLEVVDTGNAKILQDGKVYSATWKKDSRTERTLYYSEDGSEFIFNRGQIWIQIIPKKEGSFSIIKQ